MVWDSLICVPIYVAIQVIPALFNAGYGWCYGRWHVILYIEFDISQKLVVLDEAFH